MTAMPSETLTREGTMNHDDAPAAGREILAWHFVGDTLRGGRPVPADGVELRHYGPVVMYESGLYASVRAIDALQYAAGTTACRVLVRDVVVADDDKLVARSRTILWRVDATDVLREFARDCALDVLHLWATPETPGIDTVVEYLLTGDESLRDAAQAAAWNAWDAVRTSAWDAWAAAWDTRDAWEARVACASAWAAWAAGHARDDDVWGAKAAARTARAVARDDARDAVWGALNTRLERMLEEAR